MNLIIVIASFVRKTNAVAWGSTIFLCFLTSNRLSVGFIHYQLRYPEFESIFQITYLVLFCESPHPAGFVSRCFRMAQRCDYENANKHN